MTKIDDQKWIDAFHKVVAEKGEQYRYPAPSETAIGRPMDDDYHKDFDCVYSTPSGEPACIVGYVIAELGLPVPAYSIVGPAEQILRQQRFRASDRIVRAAQAAQNEQDQGHTWGQALEAFYSDLRFSR